MLEANVSIQILCMIITVILLICNYMDSYRNSPLGKLMTQILWLNVAELIFYIGGWTLEGIAALEVLVTILTAGQFCITYGMAVFYTLYVAQCIKKKNKSDQYIINAVLILCIIAIGLSIVSIFNGMYFTCEDAVYQRGPLFLMNQLYAFLVLGPDTLLILCHRKELGHKKVNALISYVILPCVAAFVQLPFPHFDTMCPATTLAILIIYLMIHMERKVELEKKLLNLRIDTMMSQVNPHFIYNTLAIIQDECHEKAPLAEETVVQFAEFMRRNMDSLQEKNMIPFKEELEHTRNYLNLEKKRFEDLLQVKWEVDTQDFFVPALSLQPLVENAVYHGIMKKESGGTITIIVKEQKHSYMISVADDGVGFDDQTLVLDSGDLGIENVRARLDDMCKGTIEIQSKLEEGTKVTIRIPK